MIWPVCAGVLPELRKRPSSSAPAATGWKASGTPVHPWPGSSIFVHGMHVLVPRNMTQAAGFYNTLLRSDDPALVIEVLNGYRQKERKPDNIGEFTLPLGVPEIVRPGKDVTIVTYGALVRIALEAGQMLAEAGIDSEIIDVQSLLPFDINGLIVESLKKTSRILFLDEDMPGGTTAYMMQQVLEVQKGYQWLDSAATYPLWGQSPPGLWFRWQLLFQT